MRNRYKKLISKLKTSNAVHQELASRNAMSQARNKKVKEEVERLKRELEASEECF